MPALPRADDLKPAVSRRLRAARAVVYDTAAGCARALGVPKNTWGNYEKGAAYPDPAHLVRFCDATGFTTDFIYRGRFRGITEDVQIRLAADHPELVDEAPDVVRSSTAAARA
jgi:transcriptional regulator with XRE-family HTH domain